MNFISQKIDHLFIYLKKKIVKSVINHFIDLTILFKIKCYLLTKTTQRTNLKTKSCERKFRSRNCKWNIIIKKL